MQIDKRIVDALQEELDEAKEEAEFWSNAFNDFVGKIRETLEGGLESVPYVPLTKPDAQKLREQMGRGCG